MEIYFEDSWYREKEYLTLSPNEEKVVRELKSALLDRDFEKARQMFIEMDLQWDLNELDRIVSYR